MISLALVNMTGEAMLSKAIIAQSSPAPRLCQSHVWHADSMLSLHFSVKIIVKLSIVWCVVVTFGLWWKQIISMLGLSLCFSPQSTWPPNNRHKLSPKDEVLSDHTEVLECSYIAFYHKNPKVKVSSTPRKLIVLENISGIFLLRTPDFGVSGLSVCPPLPGTTFLFCFYFLLGLIFRKSMFLIYGAVCSFVNCLNFSEAEQNKKTHSSCCQRNHW